MGQRKLIENGLPCGIADSRTQLCVSQQSLEPLHEFPETGDRNQPSIPAMINDFLDALATAGDYRLATGHCFQIYTSEPLVPAGQRKNRAVPHGFRHFGTASSSKKVNPIADAQISGQASETIAICS